MDPQQALLLQQQQALQQALQQQALQQALQQQANQPANQPAKQPAKQPAIQPIVTNTKITLLSTSQNPPLTIAQGKKANQYQYFSKEEVKADLSHLKGVIAKYSQVKQGIKELRDRYEFWSHDIQLIQVIESATEDKRVQELSAKIGETVVDSTATYLRGDLQRDDISQFSEEQRDIIAEWLEEDVRRRQIRDEGDSVGGGKVHGGGKFTKYPSYAAWRASQLARAVSVPMPIPFTTEATAFLPYSIRKFTSWHKKHFTSIEKDIESNYLTCLGIGKVREKFEFEIKRWAQKNKEDVKTQLLNLQRKVILNYSQRVTSSPKTTAGDYETDFSPSSDLTQIFGVDESVFVILSKLQTQDTESGGTLPTLASEIIEVDSSKEYSFKTLTKDLITSEEISALENQIKSLDRRILRLYKDNTERDRLEGHLDALTAELQRMRSKKSSQEKFKQELLQELSQYYRDTKQQILSKKLDEGVVNVNTLVNEFEFQPTLEGFFSNWNNGNEDLGPVRKELTLQEIQVGKQLFLTEIDRVANNNADYQGDNRQYGYTFDLVHKYLTLALENGETLLLESGDNAQVSDILGEGLRRHYSGVEYLLKTHLPLPEEIVQPLEDTANQFLIQNNQSDEHATNIMDSIQRIKELIRKFNIEIQEQIRDYTAKSMEAPFHEIYQPGNKERMRILERLVGVMVTTADKFREDILGEARDLSLIIRITGVEDMEKLVNDEATAIDKLFTKMGEGFFDKTTMDGTLSNFSLNLTYLVEVINRLFSGDNVRGVIAYIEDTLDTGKTPGDRGDRGDPCLIVMRSLSEMKAILYMVRMINSGYAKRSEIPLLGTKFRGPMQYLGKKAGKLFGVKPQITGGYSVNGILREDLAKFKFSNETLLTAKITAEEFLDLISHARNWYPDKRWEPILQEKVPDERIIDDMCKYMYYDYWFRQYETILQLYETQYDSLKSFGVKYHGIDPTKWSRFKGLFSYGFDRRMEQAGLKQLIPSTKAIVADIGGDAKQLIMSLNDPGNEKLKKLILEPNPLLEGRLNAFIELLQREAKEEQEREKLKQQLTETIETTEKVIQKSEKDKQKKDKQKKDKQKKDKAKEKPTKEIKKQFTPIKRNKKQKATKLKDRKADKDELKRVREITEAEVKRLEDTRDRVLPDGTKKLIEKQSEEIDTDKPIDEGGLLSKLYAYFSSREETTQGPEPLLQSQPTDKPVTGNEYIPGNILDELRSDLLKIRESENAFKEKLKQDKLAHSAEMNRMMTLLANEHRLSDEQRQSQKQLDRINQGNLQFKEQELNRYAKRKLDEIKRQQSYVVRERIQQQKEFQKFKRDYIKKVQKQLAKQMKPGNKSKKPPRILYDMTQRMKTSNPVLSELKGSLEQSYSQPIAYREKSKKRTVKKGKRSKIKGGAESKDFVIGFKS